MKLARSDLLVGEDGRYRAIVSITEKRSRFTVFNFEVEGTHTYYANGWLVHNAPCGRRSTQDQRALLELVDETPNGGRRPLSVEDAEYVLQLAGELRFPGVRAGIEDVASPSNWTATGGLPHIHLPGAGRNGHVWVEPGVPPRSFLH